MKVPFSVLSLIAGVALVGCGGRVTSPFQSQTLAGSSWSSACSSLGEGAGSTKVTYEYSVSTENRKDENFSDSSCSQPVTQVRKLSSFIEGASREDMGTGAKEFIRNFDSRFVTPFNESEVSRLNENRYCGVSDWQIGVERDISTCRSGYTDIPREKNVYWVHNDILKFGDKTNPITGQREADFEPSEFESVEYTRNK